VSRRLALVAEPALAELHGLNGGFPWGEARTFRPDERDALTAWSPATVVALETPPPPGPWHAIAWGASGERRVGRGDGVWRRAPLPAADALVALAERAGTGVLVAGGETEERGSALAKLRARSVPVTGTARLTVADLERAAVVALLGPQQQPLPDAAAAVLAAGRVLIAPRSAPTFGLLPWSDHIPYANEDELVFSADSAFSFPKAFEPLVAMGMLAAEAHLASAVYGRLAVDAELSPAA
jgi:hypothetical protein